MDSGSGGDIGPDSPLSMHELLRAAEVRFQEERDRRYTEVGQEREKALKIKETADLAALELAREIQVYKDSKANDLREQISSERGLYVTKLELQALSEKFEALISPMNNYVASQNGRSEGVSITSGVVVVVVTLIISTLGIVFSAHW